MRGWVRLLLFATSYAPLYLIFFVRSWRGVSLQAVVHSWKYNGPMDVLGLVPNGSIVWLFAMALSIVFLAFLLKIPQRYTSATVPIKKMEKRNGEALTYIVTYVVPFMAIDQQSAADLAALSILLLVMAYIYVNSNLIYTNPTLAFIGYSIYSVTTVKESDIIVISRRRSSTCPESLKLIWFAENVYLEVTANDQSG